jgi:hypothetical protein
MEPNHLSVLRAVKNGAPLCVIKLNCGYFATVHWQKYQLRIDLVRETF